MEPNIIHNFFDFAYILLNYIIENIMLLISIIHDFCKFYYTLNVIKNIIFNCTTLVKKCRYSQLVKSYKLFVATHREWGQMDWWFSLWDLCKLLIFFYFYILNINF